MYTACCTLYADFHSRYEGTGRIQTKTFSATCVSLKWEIAQNIELCHTSNQEAIESSRVTTVPFDTATLGFVHLDHILHIDDSTGHLEQHVNFLL